MKRHAELWGAGGLMGALLIAAGGCGRGEAPLAPDDSDRLYRETVALAGAYADSISIAPDSAAAWGALERFGELLDSVSFAVAPDTDLLLTEAENDTIFLRVMAVREACEKRLRELSDEMTADTLTNHAE